MMMLLHYLIRDREYLYDAICMLPISTKMQMKILIFKRLNNHFLLSKSTFKRNIFLKMKQFS